MLLESYKGGSVRVCLEFAFHRFVRASSEVGAASLICKIIYEHNKMLSLRDGLEFPLGELSI